MRQELFVIPGIDFPVAGYSVMLVLAFLIGTWWAMRNAMRLKADPDMMVNLGFVALIFSMIGSRLFYVIHYWEDQFADAPAQALNIFAGGFEFYGGLLCALVTGLLYMRFKRVSVRLYMDLLIPALLFGMALGRVGCFLHGCCWGGPCPASVPWAVEFPCSSPPFHRQWENRLVTLPAELMVFDDDGAVGVNATSYVTLYPRHLISGDDARWESVEKRYADAKAKLEAAKASGDAIRIARAEDQYGRFAPFVRHHEMYGLMPSEVVALIDRHDVRSQPVHPVQLYAAIGPMLLAIFAQIYLHRRKKHGVVVVTALMLYSVQRFIEELIRIDNPQDTFGLTISQGVSIGIFVLMVLMRLWLQSQPDHSSRGAIPYSRKKKDSKNPPEASPATPA